MEFLKAQANQIGEQLKGMTNSQRIAIVLSAVVVLAGAWGLLSWAGRIRTFPFAERGSAKRLERIAERALARSD